MSINVSGEAMKLGDWVCFRYGVERCGEIVNATIVSGDVLLTLVFVNSDEEEIYVDKFEDECWLE